jgi:hypothetical protein
VTTAGKRCPAQFILLYDLQYNYRKSFCVWFLTIVHTINPDVEEFWPATVFSARMLHGNPGKETSMISAQRMTAIFAVVIVAAGISAAQDQGRPPVAGRVFNEDLYPERHVSFPGSPELTRNASLKALDTTFAFIDATIGDKNKQEK